MNADRLPRNLHSVAGVRAFDAALIGAGTPGIVLMKRAARAVLDGIRATWPDHRSLSVLCGSGNNAGDGYLVAAFAHEAGMAVQLIAVGDVTKLTRDALEAHAYASRCGLETMPPDTELAGDVVVDALLGTGFKGDLRGPYRDAIERTNRTERKIVAVDVPSGLDADTGHVADVAVQADMTVTFIGVKRGLLTGHGPDFTGTIVFDGLGADPMVEPEPAASRLVLQELLDQLPTRPRSSHKGRHGHVLLAGGDVGMPGAITMAAEAAARAGAGLVTVLTRPEHAQAIVIRTPEVMVLGVDRLADANLDLARYDGAVLGPGLGRSAWSRDLFDNVIASKMPLVLDADALNLLAEKGGSARGRHWIVTPHPGEASRLLGCSTATVQADRFAAVVELSERYGGVAVLKGAGTLVADGRAIGLCPYGNPGMGTGGMGDVLSGIVGGLLVQGMTPFAAASLGVALHSYAADEIAGEFGERGMLATDITHRLRRLMHRRPPG